MKPYGWPSHWLLGEDHRVFRNALSELISPACEDLSRPDARENLGDEDSQCQHFFTKIYSLMRASQDSLSKALLCCSKIEDVVLEFRHYRSVRRRLKRRKRAQLVEDLTGADFGLTLEVNVPDEILADRSVLGQAKLVDGSAIPIDRMQLNDILRFAGPESATYLIWGGGNKPVVVSAENIRTLSRVSTTNRMHVEILRYGKPFEEFLIESFVGLWFGRDFDHKSVGVPIPDTSPTALYVMLHLGPPPPNVVHLSIGTSRSRNRTPGVYVNETIDLDEEGIQEDTS